MNLADIRTGLKARLENIANLTVLDKAQESINEPGAVAIIVLSEVSYGASIAGGGMYRFTVQLIVAQGDWREAQEALDEYIEHSSDKSILAAVEGDYTWGTAHVVRASNYGLKESWDRMGVDFEIECIVWS